MQLRDLTFRVFVSSTFSDLVAERNALQEDVFPRLRRYCQRHGARFQAIDLRWGISEEAGLDQQTMNICLEELHRCQRTSPRPNFIFLLGQRYGWCPLPPQIAAAELESLLDVLPEEAQQRLRRWYWRDDNAVPAEYCLQPREGRFQDRAAWGTEEWALHAILCEAIGRVGWAATDARRLKFETAATHQEILHGALQVEDAGAYVFGFFRTIQGLPPDETANGYLDFDPAGRPDAEAQARLNRFKADLRARLPGNIHTYTATWTGTGHSGTHLEQLCSDVYDRLRKVIEDRLRQRDRSDPVDLEAIAHSTFGQDRARHFIGRQATLDTIRKYLQGNRRHPMVLYGVSGVGKSALLAKAAGERPQVTGRAPEVVVRYIGGTPASSDLRALLEGLCKEIALRYGRDPAGVPVDVQNLKRDFPLRLALATADRPLALFLDALDQLSPADGAHWLGWLPRELPPHAKLIVSVVECDGGDSKAERPDASVLVSVRESTIFDAARSHVPGDCLIRIEPLSADCGAHLLDAWLQEARRTLQPAQRTEVLDKFARNGLPLYLKLAFEDARRWKSWMAQASPRVTTLAPDIPGWLIDRFRRRKSTPVEPSPSLTLAPDIPGLLQDLFARLEQPRYHGRLLASRALGYLAASRHGLTEDEMLDVLSADKEVMADFIGRCRTERAKPDDLRLKSLPFLIWSRLRADLEPYLAERLADGTAVMTFYHRQLALEAKQRYLVGLGGKTSHVRLADYFEGVREMPERKVAEWPWQLQQAESWGRLETTLTDLDLFLALSNADRFQVWRYLSSFPGQGRDIGKVYEGALNRWHLELGDSERYELGMNEVGHLLFVTEHKSAATALFDRAYSLAEKLYDAGDIRMAVRKNNRAAMRGDQGKWQEALELFLSARPVFEKEYGTDHPDTWVLREGLAVARTHTKQIDSGIKDLKACLQWYENKYGAIHHAVANCAWNLGVANTYLGEFAEAARHFDSAANICQQALGVDNPQTVHLAKERQRWAAVAKCEAQAVALDKSGKADAALAAYQRMEDLCEQLASKPGMAVSLFGKAKLLRRVNDSARAKDTAEMALMFAENVGMQLTAEIEKFSALCSNRT